MIIGSRSVGGIGGEIDDSLARFDLTQINEAFKRTSDTKAATYKLDQIFHHDDLYKKYPEIRSVPITIETTSNQKGLSGGWDADKGDMKISFPDDWRSFDKSAVEREISATILHEMQHAVQQIERIPSGSNPNQWRDAVSSLVKDDPEKLNTLIGDMKGVYSQQSIDRMSASVAYLQDSVKNFDAAEASGVFDKVSTPYKYDTFGEVRSAERIEQLTNDARILAAVDRVTYALYMHDEGEYQARMASDKFKNQSIEPKTDINVRELPGAPTVAQSRGEKIVNVKFALSRISHQASQIKSHVMKEVSDVTNKAIENVKASVESVKDFSGRQGENLKNAAATALSVLAKTKGRDFSGQTLSDMKFPDKTDFSGSNFANAKIVNCDMPGAIMREVNMTNAVVSGANLTESNFAESKLDGATFSSSNLTASSFAFADARRATFNDSKLLFADFKSANLESGIVVNCQTKGADFKNANVSNVSLVEHNKSVNVSTLSGARDFDVKHEPAVSIDLHASAHHEQRGADMAR